MALIPLSRSHQPSRSKLSKEKEEQRGYPPPEELEEEDDDDEGVEEDENQAETPLTLSKSPSKAETTQDNGSSSGSGSESESESDVSPSRYKVQPITKPPPISALSKRRNPDDTTDQRSSKKSKPEGKEKKAQSPSPITRLWSNEDEITVLRGMDEFKDQISDLGAFLNSIKGKLQGDYSKEQLRSKIKGMKRRFSNATKKVEDGSDPVFSKPHEHMSYMLSKKIWGADVDKGVDETNAKKDKAKVDKIRGVDEKEKGVKKDKVKVDKISVVDEKEKGGEDEEGSFLSKFPYLSASFDNVARNYPSLGWMRFVKDNLSLIGSEKAKELDDKWKELLMEKREINYKMAAFVRNQAKMAFDQ